MRRRSWRLFFEFLAHTGLRIGEAIALTWDDVDFGHRRIHVRRRFYRGRYDSPKSKYGRRTIPLSQGLSQALWRLSGARPDDALVFVSATGKTMDSSNLMSRVLKPAAKTAGVPWVGFHTFPTHLRHDALSSRTEREAGADVARPSLASVHARNVCSPAA